MNDNSAAGLLFGGLGIGILLFYIAIAVFFVYMYWRIATKAGYPGWYALGLLIPCLNLIDQFPVN